MSTTQSPSIQLTLKDLNDLTERGIKEYEEIKSQFDGDEDAEREFIIKKILASPEKVKLITEHDLCAVPMVREKTQPYSHNAYSTDDPNVVSGEWQKFYQRTSDIVNECDKVTKYGGTDTPVFNDKTYDTNYNEHSSCSRVPSHVATSNVLMYLGELPDTNLDDYPQIGFKAPFAHLNLSKFSEWRKENGKMVRRTQRHMDEVTLIHEPRTDVPEYLSMTKGGKVWVKTLDGPAQDYIDSKLPSELEGVTIDTDGKGVGELIDLFNTHLITAAQSAGRDLKKGITKYDEILQKYTGVTESKEPTILKGIPSNQYRVGKTYFVPSIHDPEVYIKVNHAWAIPENRRPSTDESKSPDTEESESPSTEESNKSCTEESKRLFIKSSCDDFSFTMRWLYCWKCSL